MPKGRITRAVRRKRLQDFLAFMKDIKPEKVVLSTIAEGFDQGKQTCGSIGCLMGWAPAVPSLAKAGLYWDPSTTHPDPRTKQDRAPTRAVGNVLGLHEDDWSWAFDAGSNVDEILAERYKTTSLKKDTDKQKAVNRLRFMLELDALGALPLPGNSGGGFYNDDDGEMSDEWTNPKFTGRVKAY